MCFCLHQKYPNEKIATKDIVCYKVLKSTIVSTLLESMFYFKVYELNKLYKTILDKPKETFLVFGYISKGFHSYSNKREAFKKRLNNDCYVVKGIIPKGSKYYYNPDRHEYVSNQIILQEVIK